MDFGSSNIIFTGGDEEKDKGIERENFFGVKNVNAGTCDGEVNIPGKAAVMDPEEGTTKHTKEQAEGMQNKEKNRFRGTVQKTAVQ